MAVDERIPWLLAQIGASPPLTSPEDAAASIAGDDPMGLLHWLAGQLQGFALDSITRASDVAATVRVSCPNGRTWDLKVTLEDAPTQRIEWVQLDRALLDGMEVRVAGPGDGAGIAEVCRNTEIVLGDLAVTIDPGEDYFAAIRLMDQATVLVATHHDRVVAVHCGVSYPITYNGERQNMSQILHSRVLKEYAGLGLWSIMNRILVNGSRARGVEAARTGGYFQNGCAYFAADNEAARRLNGAQSPWSFQPLRLVLSCEWLATRATTIEWHAADPTDAVHVVELLNDTHAGEELFVPYTEASLRERLGRAPDAYGWPNLLVSDDAVIGVWNAGRTHTKRRLDAGGSTRSSVRALVFDHGFRAGAEDAFEQILAEAARRAMAAGMTHLTIFTSDAARGSTRLRELAEESEPYILSTPYTPEPEGAAARGLYVDQVYF
ncbi:MAG TPA: hypothetical protein VM143_01510 [Acidimicrobiales bacterium]|nr:hypothetical protein [Acidimicrobiales bacterium]